MKKIKITEAQAKLLGLIKEPKQKLKITQEQYNRIFGSKIVTENSEVVGGLNRVDNSIKKSISSFNENDGVKMDSMTMADFKKPLAGVSSSSQKFGKSMTEENEGVDQTAEEFVKFLYGRGELSESWTEDMVKEAIAKLCSKKLIVATEDGNFKVSTSLGDPKTAMDAIRQELESLKPQSDDMEQGLEPMGIEGELEEEDTTHPSSPDYLEPNKIQGVESKQPTIYEVIYLNGEMVLLDKEGSLFYFNYRDSEYFDTIKSDYTGSWEAGEESGKNELTTSDMQNFINDYMYDLSVGFGIEGLHDGMDLVELDDAAKQWVLSTYQNDKQVTNILGQTSEGVEDDFKAHVKNAFTKSSVKKIEGETPEEKAARIKRSLDAIRTKEMASRNKEIEETALGTGGGGLAPGVFQGDGYNNAPVVPLGMKKKSVYDDDKEVPVVAEKLNEGPVAGGESTGAYDANALGNIGRDGEFKKEKKPKAFKTPQWAGGSFPEQPDCSKPNNNKEAQNGGCNSGASSLKVKKGKGSVNAPSLAENKIYEAIAVATGKSVDEIKRIIVSKNGKI